MDFKDFSLDVYERCLFWLVSSYFISSVLSFIGFSFYYLFFLILIPAIVLVVVFDRIKVDPNGRGVLITGCDTGFGNAAAKKFHKLGFTVFAGVYSTDTDGAKGLKQEFKNRMFVFPMDVTSDESVKDAMTYVNENLGDSFLWAVIANAGWSTFGEVEWVPLDVYEKIMNINLFGTIRTVRAAMPLIRRSKGRIILISSMCGRFGAYSRSAYTCTKWAVEGLAECLRAEMKRWSVDTVVIEPGNFVAATALYAGNAIKSQSEHMWKNLTEEVRGEYGEDYFNTAVEKMTTYAVTGNSDIEPVLQTMVEAVSHSFPQTRYQVMSLKEKVKCFVATHLPSVLYDRCYN